MPFFNGTVSVPGKNHYDKIAMVSNSLWRFFYGKKIYMRGMGAAFFVHSTISSEPAPMRTQPRMDFSVNCS